MTPIDDALRCASLFIGYAVDHAPDGWPAIRQRQLTEAGEHIRRLVAENEAATALVQQMLEAMDGMLAFDLDGMSGIDSIEIASAVVTVAREWLGQKGETG